MLEENGWRERLANNQNLTETGLPVGLVQLARRIVIRRTPGEFLVDNNLHWVVTGASLSGIASILEAFFLNEPETLSRFFGHITAGAFWGVVLQIIYIIFNRR